MKKVLLAAFVVVGLMATSCKKDRTCTCTTTGGGLTSSVSGTIKDTKKKAEDKCNEGDSTYDLFGETYKVDCEID